jgi:endonuclease/exonuclease/phosphatase family metal-dependent hydrolase
VEQLDADIVCLQEVRKLHRREEQYFTRWPELPQAEFLCPEGYFALYQTNAKTKHGEHGNALLSRWPVVSHGHEDMSDHRFEQRGLLHAELKVGRRKVHVIVLHLGLIAGSRGRQVEQMLRFIEREIPSTAPVIVAGDFNDWGSKLRPLLNSHGFQDFLGERALTYPSRLPLTQLDYVYCRGLKPVGLQIPRGRIWWRMSDHLPLIAEFKV